LSLAIRKIDRGASVKQTFDQGQFQSLHRHVDSGLSLIVASTEIEILGLLGRVENILVDGVVVGVAQVVHSLNQDEGDLATILELAVLALQSGIDLDAPAETR
jgi:hypothetical protein